MDYFLMAFRKHTQFDGRSGRSEYWYFILFNLFIYIYIVLAVLDGVSGVNSRLGVVGSLALIYYFVILIPGWAVTIRRLHDIGKSGWWFFVSSVPVAGLIWFIVLMAQEGNKGPNKYGPNPKQVERAR